MLETLKFYKNFPKEGINFIDIIPFLQSRKAFAEVVEALNKATTAPNVAAPEARAFLFASPLLTTEGEVENIIPYSLIALAMVALVDVVLNLVSSRIKIDEG